MAGQVWSWGAGTHGQLASGALEDRLEPLLLSSFDAATQGSFVLDMACGGGHAVALINEDERVKVLTWGNGDSGALGHGDGCDITVPKLLDHFNSITICSVAAGWSHTAFVSVSGELYTCGSGSFGQLGHGDFSGRLMPCKVESLSGKSVSMAACGMRHTLVLSHAQGTKADSEVFSFGSSRRGQLGLENLDATSKEGSISRKVAKLSAPQEITNLRSGHSVVLIAANGDHSAAMTVMGEIYLWGRGFCGESDCVIPVRASHPQRFSNVALGWNHGLALTDEGVLWAWGSNQRGQLGCIEGAQSEPFSSNTARGNQDDVTCENSTLSFESEQTWPTMVRVHGLEGQRVVGFSAGSEHSAALLDNGKLLGWGWGEHGQLGLGTTEDQPYPQVVSLPGLSRRVFCGSGFTFAVVDKSTGPSVC